MPMLSIRGLSLSVSLTVVVVSGALSAVLSYDAANKAVDSTRESGDRGVDFAFAVGSASASNLTVRLFYHVLNHVEERVQGFLGAPLTSLTILLRQMSTIPPDRLLSAAWRMEHLEQQVVQTHIALSRSGVRSIVWGSPWGASVPQWFFAGEFVASRREAEPIRRDGYYLHSLGRNDGESNASCLQENERPFLDVVRRAGLWNQLRCGMGVHFGLVDTNGATRGGPCRFGLFIDAYRGISSTAEFRAKARADAARSCPDLLEGSALCSAGGLCNCSEAVRRVPCSSNRTIPSPGGAVSEPRTVQQLCPQTCAVCPVPDGMDPDGFGDCFVPDTHYLTRTSVALMMSGLWNASLEPGVPHYCGLNRGRRKPSVQIGGTFDHPDQPEHPVLGRRVGTLQAQLDAQLLSVFLRTIELPGDGRVAIIQVHEPFPPPLTAGSASLDWMLIAASHGRSSRPTSTGGGEEVISVLDSDDAVIAAGAGRLIARSGRLDRNGKGPVGVADPNSYVPEYCGSESLQPWEGPNRTLYILCSHRMVNPKLAGMQWVLMVILSYDSVMGRIERMTDNTRARIRAEAHQTSEALQRHWLVMAGIIAGCTSALMLMTALLVVGMTRPLQGITQRMAQFGRARMTLAIATSPEGERLRLASTASDMSTVDFTGLPVDIPSQPSASAGALPPPRCGNEPDQLSRLSEIACLQQTFAELKVSLDHAQTMRDAALREQTRLQVEAEVQSAVESQLREELTLEQRRQEAAERKRREQAALAREAALRAEAQSVTAKYLAHEVRNNLMPISRLVSTRSGDDKDWEVASHALELVNESLQRSLDLGKLRCGLYEVTPTTFDVASQVRLVASVVRARAGERVCVCAAEEVPSELWVHSDYYLVHTLLINLASNAVKYTDHGTVSICCAHDGSGLVVSVADTGRGIDAQKAETLFSEYRACKQQLGTGLGLPLCKSIVDTLNGSISFSGRDGGGTTFSAAIPCALAELPRSPEPSPAEGRLNLPRQCSVMIVDDDVCSQKVIKHRLTLASGEDGKDWRYQMCSSAESALSLLLTPRGTRQSSLAESTNLVLVDEHMPLGGGEMLGTEAIRRLRAGGFTGAVIGCSGNTLAQDHHNSGADCSWCKPPPPPQTVRTQLAEVLSQAARRNVGEQVPLLQSAGPPLSPALMTDW